MPYWTTLTTQQLGRYAEYLARLRFARSGMDVYIPEIDDRGIDFIVRTARGDFYEIQSKARRQLLYFYIEKSKFPISKARYLYLSLFTDTKKEEPDIFLIPSIAWLKPNALFVDRPYDDPEVGLQFSKKNMHLLEPYRIFDIIEARGESAARDSADGGLLGELIPVSPRSSS